ncbi:MAG: hypothetical protein DMF63_05315 [Acidobacteria bacterium]|nr:MAG: hypothetical protein DMF63_05315 [Acidobacteriota bacterium]
MNDNVSQFLKVYESISTWGPDRIQNEYFSSSYAIEFSDSVFFNSLYVSVPVEHKLIKMLSEPLPGSLLAFCGPAGSGKSTVSHRVKQRLEENKGNLVIFVDMRSERAGKTHDDSDDGISDTVIREIILSRFRRLFDLNHQQQTERQPSPRAYFPDTERSLKDELVYFSLAPENYTSQAFDVFSTEGEELLNLYRTHHKDQSEKKRFESWYWECQYEAEIQTIRRSVLSKIDIVHYIAFIRDRKLYDKVFIWLDNLDSFSNEQQVRISNFLQTAHKPVVNTCQIVVSVREENIYRIGDFHDSFTEPYVTKVTIGDPDKDTDDVVEYKALNVSVINQTDLMEIVRKKIDFTNIRCSHLYDDQASSSAWPTPDEYESALDLSSRVLDCFKAEKVILLANNSIREFLRIHAKFLRFLFEQTSPRITQILKSRSNWQLSTEFLSWLHVLDEPLRLNTFNIMSDIARFETGFTPKEIGCFLPYIVLTRIWNECLRLRGRPSPANNPYLHRIVEDIEQDFRYERNDILQTVLDLYGKAGRRSNFITFRKKQRVERVEDLPWESTVRITYRGKVTVGSVICSFGYLRDCSERLVPNLPDYKVETQVIENIRSIAEIHLASLQSIRDMTFPTDKNWFSKYLLRYGLPLEPAFVRMHPDTGRKIKGYSESRTLFVNSILVSILSFFKHDRIKRPLLIEIKSKFDMYLAQLEAGKAVECFDFELEGR